MGSLSLLSGGLVNPQHSPLTPPVEGKAYLNLGCGHRCHAEWINMDLRGIVPGIIVHDLRLGIPLSDNSCKVVYSSSFVEHLHVEEASFLFDECYRVLEPGGVIRIATPDLEAICRNYLEKLEAVLGSDTGAESDYDWTLLELYDQVVREEAGGATVHYLSQNPLPNEAFVLGRIGEEGRDIMRLLRHRNVSQSKCNSKDRGSVVLAGFGRLLRFLKSWARRIRNRAMEHVAGPDFETALRIGRFRLSGEVHHWMYDQYSLKRLMLKVGFSNPVRQTPTGSLVPNWQDFYLDALPDGTVIKPDSMYIEATKPCRL